MFDWVVSRLHANEKNIVSRLTQKRKKTKIWYFDMMTKQKPEMQPNKQSLPASIYSIYIYIYALISVSSRRTQSRFWCWRKCSACLQYQMPHELRWLRVSVHFDATWCLSTALTMPTTSRMIINWAVYQTHPLTSTKNRPDIHASTFVLVKRSFLTKKNPTDSKCIFSAVLFCLFSDALITLMR